MVCSSSVASKADSCELPAGARREEIAVGGAAVPARGRAAGAFQHELTAHELADNRKSDKELAFLQDLFIAPDWGERFAELIDEHVTPPKEG